MKLVIWNSVRKDLACACTMHNIVILGSLPFLTQRKFSKPTARNSRWLCPKSQFQTLNCLSACPNLLQKRCFRPLLVLTGRSLKIKMTLGARPAVTLQAVDG